MANEDRAPADSRRTHSPPEQELILTTFQEVADRTFDAARERVQAFYEEVAKRIESAIDAGRRFIGDFAENVESALTARQESARVGLGGRIRQ
ncbi:hypothetical protein SMNI109538_22245 [Smaragdicoccus niigatensis]